MPRLREGKNLQGLFQFAPRVQRVGLRYDREPGFFLGSIYFNYGLTALFCAIAYPVLSFGRFTTDNVAMAIVFTFAILFPIWFFRYARSLWLGMDQFWDPREKVINSRSCPLTLHRTAREIRSRDTR